MVDEAPIVIVGASSAVAQSVALLHARAKKPLVLLARSADKLAQLKAHYLAQGSVSVSTIACELADVSSHSAAMQEIDGLARLPCLYYVFYGSLPEQNECEHDHAKELDALSINFLSVSSWLNLIAQRLEQQQRGTIVAVSSVAGDRGRQSNYVYGAAKGGLSIYLQGLRNRLHHSGVNVLTVKPGFIDTPMTEKFDKSFLWATPDSVAKDIERAVNKGKSVVFTPWFWRYIMWVIRAIPESVFKRLRL